MSNQNVEKNSRDVVITGVAGILEGFIGVPLSILVYQGYRAIGMKGKGRQIAWAASGVVGVPLSLVLTSAIVAPINQANVAPTNNQNAASIRDSYLQRDDLQYRHPVLLGEFALPP